MAKQLSASAVVEGATMTITRRLSAPLDLVWAAWTDPQQLPIWWGPRGFSCATKEIDIRPGGVWRFDFNGPDGAHFKNRVQFEAITPPSSITYVIDDDGAGEFAPFRSTATFKKETGGTLVTLRMELEDEADLKRRIEEFGALEGGESHLDNMEEHVLTALEPDDHALVLVRRIKAPRALVWKAWTTPEHLVHWFTPDPVKTTECRIDLRPGGEFYTKMVMPDGTESPGTGCYLEVVHNERLTWTDALLPGYRPSGGGFMTAILTFEDCMGGTKYVATALHKDMADRDRHEEMGFHDGWGTVAMQLEKYAQGMKG